METLRTSPISSEGGFNKVPWELALQGVDYRWVCVHTTHVCVFVGTCVYISSLNGCVRWWGGTWNVLHIKERSESNTDSG